MSDRHKKPKRPRDVSQLAKRVVDISIGQESDEDSEPVDEKARRRGIARAEKLTAEERTEIAKKAARARWDKEK